MSHSPSASATLKRHKPSSYPGKENILPLPLTPKDGSSDAAFRRILGGHHSYHDLNSVETAKDSQLMGSCVRSSLSLTGFNSESVKSVSNNCKSSSQSQNPCWYRGVAPFLSNSIESRLLSLSSNGQGEERDGVDVEEALDLESSTQLDVLMKLCSGEDDSACQEPKSTLECPLCGIDISQWDEDPRMSHANECLDKSDSSSEIAYSVIDKQQLPSHTAHKPSVPSSAQVANVTPVVEWLQSLGLARYEAVFIQEEIDWDSLQSLTEEDLIAIGVTALGPRKKIVQSLKELTKKDNILTESANGDWEYTVDVTKKVATNRLITEYFSSPSFEKKEKPTSSKKHQAKKAESAFRQRRVPVKNIRNRKDKQVPLWCSIPGTPFRVDAFQYLQRDCSHWFLTHFHIDHYQGLTRSFTYGKIYCSKITAKLVNSKIGLPWERIQVMPLNEKINVAGVDVTCYDANHCPGSIIILFEPPNGKPVLHSGDFRLNEELAQIFAEQDCCIHTLILDTTYCNPQYNFPKQENVFQFVIEAIQAESFNQKTLFLIGSYTIGKERLFLEVARVLHKKIYVTAAKLRLLSCLANIQKDSVL